MEKPIYTIGERVEKLCLTCGEERGHVVASINKRGQITRVSCPKCGSRSTFKSDGATSNETSSAKSGAAYDPTKTYRAGHSMTHPVFGVGEVTAVIEPQKIDVLFADRMRRLIHARAQR
jgi:DNA-directed RNA polymerase subunit RPC12/RpoP